uniref:Nematode cuticle collagen N-terminal domain-containing protein n=1 Tax=Plectus sambesii TaxID=2011161 RepID=A0A914XHB3_9BILA
MMDSSKESEEHRQMRRVAFIAVVVSTVAVIASVVTLPMLYNYVQNFQSHLMAEADFCKARSRDMWQQMFALQSTKQSDRAKRSWLFGQWVPEGGVGGGANGGYAQPSPPGGTNGGYGPPIINSTPDTGCC